MERKSVTDGMAEKVFELTEQFNQYVFEHPEILDHIPDQAMLVFLDADDPAFNQANLELANTLPSGGRRVYVKMQKRVRMIERVDWEAQVLSSPALAG